MSLSFGDFATQVRKKTRENSSSGTYRYADAQSLFEIWANVLKEINGLTHSRIVSNADNPILSVAGQRLYNFQSVAGANAVNEVQTVTPSAVPVGGSYRLIFYLEQGPVYSGDLLWNLTAAQIQTALEAVVGIGAGNISVTGDMLTVGLSITFQGDLAGKPIPVMGSANNSLTSGSAITLTIAEATAGRRDPIFNTDDIYEVFYNGKHLTYMQISETKEMSSEGDPWWNRAGEPPQRYYFDGEKLGLFYVPTISGRPIVLWATLAPILPPSLPASSAQWNFTSQLDSRLDKAIIYAGCEEILISRREFTWAQEFTKMKADALEKYSLVQIDRFLRGGTKVLDYDTGERF